MLPVMSRRSDRRPSLEKDLRDLLGASCVELGFCIPTADRDRIASSERIAADEFAADALRAESFDPDVDLDWLRRIERRFTDRFGDCAAADRHDADVVAWEQRPPLRG